MERVVMDLLGPLPESRRGNKYLLVVSDYFTRWVEAYPLPNSEAITVAQGFIGEYISLYGLPRQIHTDRGSQFTSLLFKNICEIFRIDKNPNNGFSPTE
jgi:transposase InsO family protein